jgi:hypothetical protein
MTLLIQAANATCEHVIEDEDGTYPCGAQSEFVVIRSDNDPSYSPNETCGEHLADMVCDTAEGDAQVHAIVHIRWMPRCDFCHRPALIKDDGSFGHAERADAVACSIFRGVPLLVTEDGE